MSDLTLTQQQLQSLTLISHLAAQLNIDVTADTSASDTILSLTTFGRNANITCNDLTLALDILHLIAKSNRSIFPKIHDLPAYAAEENPKPPTDPKPTTFTFDVIADAFRLGKLATQLHINQADAITKKQYAWANSEFVRLETSSTGDTSTTTGPVDITPDHLHLACQICEVVLRSNRDSFPET